MRRTLYGTRCRVREIHVDCGAIVPSLRSQPMLEILGSSSGISALACLIVLGAARNAAV
jgi:hypothetical protein